MLSFTYLLVYFSRFIIVILIVLCLLTWNYALFLLFAVFFIVRSRLFRTTLTSFILFLLSMRLFALDIVVVFSPSRDEYIFALFVVLIFSSFIVEHLLFRSIE